MCDSAGVFTSDEAKVVCRQLGILQVEGRDNPQLQFQLTAELNIILFFRILLSFHFFFPLLCDNYYFYIYLQMEYR